MPAAISLLVLLMVLAPGCENGGVGDDSARGNRGAAERQATEPADVTASEWRQGFHQFTVTDIEGRDVWSSDSLRGSSRSMRG
jgi:hypothetical protein